MKKIYSKVFINNPFVFIDWLNSSFLYNIYMVLVEWYFVYHQFLGHRKEG